MPEPIEFYFDFSSPYSYLAAEQIDELAARHGREVAWRPMLLGAVFKETGGQPLLNIPLKGPYARQDLDRSARLIGVPFAIPSSFPFMSVAAARAFYWMLDQDRAKAVSLAKALFRATFGQGRDIDSAEAVVGVCVAEGLDGEAAAAALKDPAVKQRLREEVDSAMAKEVFGAPIIIVDGEVFWGHDRLGQVDLWLERGGW